MHPSDNGFYPLFQQRVAESPEQQFAVFPDGSHSFADMDRTSAWLAEWLRSRKITPGDRVALMMANSALTLSLLFALARLGAIWVPINTRSRGENLSYILAHADPAIAIVDDDCVDVIEECEGVSQSLEIIRTAKLADALSSGRKIIRDTSVANVGPETPFAIMYTSGTTGRPKGVVVSHRMLRLSGEAIALCSAPRRGDTYFMWEPLFHIGGAQMIILPLIRDVTLSFVAGFSAGRFWSQVREARASHIHYLGGILQILLKQPPDERDREHDVRIAFGGGCPPDVWRPFEERFGVEIRECYGMTECSSVTTANLNGTVGSVGTPMPWFDVDILRADGTRSDTGELGEIVVTSTLDGALTAGYFKDAETTARALNQKTFRTGDFGSWDADGNMYFHGRMSDSVRVRGENVSAFEVEHVAAKHPDVEDCAMIGVDAEVGEHEIKLFVSPKPGTTVDEVELSNWLSSRLAPFQNPRYICVVNSFERTPSQRIMKHRLPKTTDGIFDRAATSRQSRNSD